MRPPPQLAYRRFSIRSRLCKDPYRTKAPPLGGAFACLCCTEWCPEKMSIPHYSRIPFSTAFAILRNLLTELIALVMRIEH